MADDKFRAGRRARNLINKRVGRGVMARPDTFSCTDCPSQAEEYDHFLGHDHEHAKDVQPVCTRCHGARRAARGEAARGEANGTSKLTELNVTTIRELWAIGFTQKELAAMYGVGQANVSMLVNRKTWNHVGGAL